MTSKDTVNRLEFKAKSGVVAPAVEPLGESSLTMLVDGDPVAGGSAVCLIDPAEGREAEALGSALSTPASTFSRPVVRNADVDWDRFNPDFYRDVNYRTFRDDDRKIVGIVRDFFAGSGLPVRQLDELDAEAATGSLATAPVRALDVGTGTNLYPALSMLPFADQVRLFERGNQNVRWLRSQQHWYDDLWEPFWRELAENAVYRSVDKPRVMFRRKTEIDQGDLFELPADSYDLGTMFFVAESMSTEEKEFAAAVEAFVGALRPGAPFAAAFMENSQGYEVGGVDFPAFAVTVADVYAAMGTIATDVSAERVCPGTSGSLRTDHEAMIVVVGRKK